MPQTLNAADHAVKSHEAVSERKRAETNEPLHGYNENNSDHCSKAVYSARSANIRQGRQKARLAEMHKSASARQVLENVLSKEIKVSGASKVKTLPNARADGNEKLSGLCKASSAAAAALEKPTGMRAPVGNFANSSIESSSIREKLKQHHRQPAHVSSSRAEEDLRFKTGNGTLILG